MFRIVLASFILLGAGCAHVAPPGDLHSPAPKALIEPEPTLRSDTALISSELEADQALTADAPAPAEGGSAPPSDGVVAPSIWSRIENGFKMESLDGELVHQWEQWYSSRPDYVQRMLERSRHFLFYVVEEIDKRQLPMELALLPMIESAYNPTAYSTAHASGMWQFIPSTGRQYGLRQNWWYDGRRDVIEATSAALDYLERLHGMFDDWQLALASYNFGEGAVGRAVERNRSKGLPTDFQSLTLPAETRNYIPKLIAIRNIISDPARFGLAIEAIPNEPYFDTVALEHDIDLDLAAELAEIPIEKFRFLNPGHKKPVIRAGEARRLVLPKAKVNVFHANLARHDKPFVSWKLVTLQRGGQAQQVAELYGMSLDQLRRASGARARFVPGQPLLVRVVGGVQNGAELPELPEVRVHQPSRPTSFPRAMKIAKTIAAARGKARVRVGAAKRHVKVVVRKASVRAVPAPRITPRRATSRLRLR